MDGSCQHKSLCSSRNITDHVKNKIQFCIKKNMSLEETANYLEKNHQISQDLTKLIWEQLQIEKTLALQIKMYNDLLAKQVIRMFDRGHLDICDPSPSIRKFRCQNIVRIHLQKTLGTSSMKKPSSASSALPDANGSSVMIPNDQHQYPWSSSNDLACKEDNSLGAPTVAPAATYQWCPSTDYAYDILSMPQLSIPNDQNQYPRSSSNDLAYSGAQTGALAATMPEDPSTFKLGGDIGHNGPSFQDTNMELAAQHVMQPDEQLQDLNRLYQPHLQLSQNFSVETQQTLQTGGSNGLENGEIIDQQLCHNFDTNKLMQMYQKQARGVKRHHPESESWNNPDWTISPEALNQHDLQRQEQQQRSLKENRAKKQKKFANSSGICFP